MVQSQSSRQTDLYAHNQENREQTVNLTMDQIIKDQSGCFTLPRSKSEVREISKPVRLKTDLSGKKLQDDPRRSTFIKISQPERLTPYRGKTESCKKNLAVTLNKPERLTPYLKRTQSVAGSCKKNTVVQNKTTKVRRNLDFATCSTKKKSKLNDRKSLLLPPNTIKNTYLKRQSTFMLPPSRCTLATTSENKCPESSKKLETCSSAARKVGCNIKRKKRSVATSAVQRTVLGVPGAIDESGISITCSSPASLTSTSRDEFKRSNSDRGIPRYQGTVRTSSKVTPESNANKVTKENATKETRVNKTEKFVTETDQEENAESLSETIKAMAVPLPRDTNVPDERVFVRKADLAALESRISRVIDILKKDLLEFTAIADMISAIKAAGEVNNEGKEETNQQTAEDEDTFDLSGNTIIYVSEKKDSDAQPSRQVGFSLDSESNKENEDDKSNDVTRSENEIKFKTRRRSARLMAKSLSNLCSSGNNDSFVDLENELNIAHPNSSAKCASAKKYRTPDMSKYKTIQKEPLMEYLALKSRMSCLVTPKTPRSFSITDSRHMCFDSGTMKANISNKVLSEIFSLYENS